REREPFLRPRSLVMLHCLDTSTISETMLGAQVRRIAHVLSESLSCGEHHFRCCRALRLPLGDIYLPTQSRVRNPALWQIALGLLLSRSAKCYETASKQ